MLRYARSNDAKIERCKIITKCGQTPNIKELNKINAIIKSLDNQNYKLDIITPFKNSISNNRFANFHLLNKTLTGKDFLTIKVNDINLQKSLFDRIIITSPEVSLIQLTKNFPIHRIMLLAMEVCGTYALNFSLNRNSKNILLQDKGFISNIPPATTLKKLQDASSYFSGSRLGDAKKFKNILSWIAQGSASPAESKLFILLCGPRKLGCFQINKLDLNKEINLSNKSAMLCGFPKIRPDLSCKDKKIAIEYDSKLFHENVESNQQDKKRCLALEHDG